MELGEKTSAISCRRNREQSRENFSPSRKHETFSHDNIRGLIINYCYFLANKLRIIARDSLAASETERTREKLDRWATRRKRKKKISTQHMFPLLNFMLARKKRTSHIFLFIPWGNDFCWKCCVSCHVALILVNQ